LSKHYDENCEELYFQQCFDICSKLGSGFFGDVFKVRSKEDGKFYAIKKSRERFKGEVDRAQKLQEVAKHEHLPEHPNLVKFYKAWEEKQRLYIQTELCECSLSEFADLNHDIPEKVIWYYLVDMLMAVNHLHSHNLVHLDIKPENIFISKDGLYKLGDFGLVIDLSQGNGTDPIEGDPKYLAKELMQGVFTQAADIFSLGITTLELAGDLDLPRCGDNWHKLRNDQIPDYSLVNVSPDLKSIILDMMHADYRKRPTADQLLQHPRICEIRKTRILRTRIKRVLNQSLDKVCQMLLFVLHLLFLFNLFDRLRRYLGGKSTPVETMPPTPTADRSVFQASFDVRSPISPAFKDSFKDYYHQSDDDLFVSSANRSVSGHSMNVSFVHNDKSTYNSYKLQDSTINSSNGKTVPLHNNITPPKSFYRHLAGSQLQSTAQRAFNGFSRISSANDSDLNFSQFNNSPIPNRRSLVTQHLDDSPTSICFNNSLSQSTIGKLSFTDVSDEDDIEHTPSKSQANSSNCAHLFDTSMHNQTSGQKNLLKVIYN
jgi:membrane-associated tyrosine/threonine-specific cdc2-inhibitory kinase